MAKGSKQIKTNGSDLDFEAGLWAAADKINSANFAWIQHYVHHLSPVGVVGFVMANGSISMRTSDEGEVRKALLEADLANAIANN